MKSLLFFLLAIALSQSSFSQKKDLFTFAALEKKFRLSDTTVKGYVHADSVAAFIKRTYNLSEPARTQRPTGEQHAIYEFRFKDRSNLYVLVNPDMWVTEITHRYNYQGRSADFTTWTAATKYIGKGKM